MAWTARDEESKKEYFDPPAELERKATELAGWIRASKHMIVFTGAGISTSAGIPDFRSGMNTQVETGPGVWELRAHGQLRSSKIRTTNTTQAIPTPTHMMFVKLMEEGLLKAVVSQNCDGLHRRSGLPVKSLFELHGNSNVERCVKCKREYLRDFRCKGVKRAHLTGRKCDDPRCGGDLRDTIVHFGENLPEKVLDRSEKHSMEADLCLAMGSSLTVTPAADIPETVGRHQRLVIVNLQSTPLDGLAAMRVFAKCDDFTRLLMSKLALEIPKFELKRRILFEVSDGGKKALIEQVDFEGNPFSYLKSVEFKGVVSKVCVPGRDPLQYEIPERGRGKEIRVFLELQGHYEEPNLELKFKLNPGTVDVSLSYDPFSGQWAITRKPDDQPVEIIVKRSSQSASKPDTSGVGTQPSKTGAQASKTGTQTTKAETQPAKGGLQPSKKGTQAKKEVKVMKQALETMDGLVDELKAAKI